MLQHVDRLPGRGELLDEFVVSRAVGIVLAHDIFELLPQAANLLIGNGKLLSGLAATLARFRLQGVELTARGHELLDELVVLRLAFFDLAAERGQFVVAGGAGHLHPGAKRGAELLSQLPNALAELRLDFAQAAAMILQRVIGPRAKRA